MLLFCCYLSLCVCQSSTICQINLKPPKVTKKLKTSTEKLNKIIEENGKKGKTTGPAAAGGGKT